MEYARQDEVDAKYKADQSLRTSHEWYKLTHVLKNMCDPDGWRDEKDPGKFWHTEPISFSDYQRRVHMSSMVPPGHLDFELRPLYPFGNPQPIDLNAVLSFAVDCHKGQFRKDGKTPYIVHPLGVSSLIRKFIKQPVEDVSVTELMMVGYLHDVMEDCGLKLNDLRDRFGYKIANLVQELTNDVEQIKAQGKDVYIVNKMLKMSRPALIVKLCDRLDNLQDLEGFDLEKRTQVRKRNSVILQTVFRLRNDIPHELIQALTDEVSVTPSVTVMDS